MADESSFLLPLLRELVYGIDAWKKPVKVVAASNVTQSGLRTVDGVALAAGDEVLCVGQASGAQNGIWVVATGAWTRRFDATTSERLFEGTRVPVTRGATGAGRVYRLATTGKISVGTTAQVWELDSQGDAGTDEDAGPAANTLALRGTGGELRAAWLELTTSVTRPTAPGEFRIDAEGRMWGWSPYQAAPSPLVVEAEFPHHTLSRFDGGATSMPERVLSPVYDLPHGNRLLVFLQFFPEGALTANATNYAIVRVYRRTALTGGTKTQLAEILSIPTGTGATGDWVAFKHIGMITESFDMPPDTYLTWEITSAGDSPPTVPACTLVAGVVRAAAIVV